MLSPPFITCCSNSDISRFICASCSWLACDAACSAVALSPFSAPTLVAVNFSALLSFTVTIALRGTTVGTGIVVCARIPSNRIAGVISQFLFWHSWYRYFVIERDFLF